VYEKCKRNISFKDNKRLDFFFLFFFIFGKLN